MASSPTSPAASGGTAVVDLDRATLVDLAGAVAALRDIGPDLHTAVRDAAHRIDDLARADADLRAELATLGIKVNALLDRRPPAAVDLRDELTAQAERIAALHELTDRLMALAVAPPAPSPGDEAVRADVSLALDVLAGLVERVESLDARVAATPTALAPPLAAEIGDAVEARVQRVADEHLSRLPEPASLTPLVDATESVRATLARLGADQARSGAAVVRIDATLDRIDTRLEDPEVVARVVRDAVREELRRAVEASTDERPGDAGIAPERLAAAVTAVLADPLTAQVADAVGSRTELALASLLRLVDHRLEGLAPPSSPGSAGDGAGSGEGPDAIDALGAQVAALGVAIDGVVTGQRELAALLAAGSVADHERASGRDADGADGAPDGLEQRLAGRLDLLGDQLRVVAERVDAAREELARRQPGAAGDGLRRAAATVRDALGGRRSG